MKIAQPVAWLSSKWESFSLYPVWNSQCVVCSLPTMLQCEEHVTVLHVNSPKLPTKPFLLKNEQGQLPFLRHGAPASNRRCHSTEFAPFYPCPSCTGGGQNWNNLLLWSPGCVLNVRRCYWLSLEWWHPFSMPKSLGWHIFHCHYWYPSEVSPAHMIEHGPCSPPGHWFKMFNRTVLGSLSLLYITLKPPPEPDILAGFTDPAAHPYRSFILIWIYEHCGRQCPKSC